MSTPPQILPDPAWTLPIIPIYGEPGSGKTTLANRLRPLPWIAVLDLDDVWDMNAYTLLNSMEAVDQKALETQNPIGRDAFFSRLRDMSVVTVKNFISQVHVEAYKTKVQMIVFVGVLFNVMDILPLSTTRFFIDVSVDTLWERLNLRTLQSIVDNARSIAHLFSPNAAFFSYPEMNPLTKKTVAGLKMLFQYKLRVHFPMDYTEIVEMKKDFVTEAVAKNYTLLDADNIYLSIMKMIRVEPEPSSALSYVRDPPLNFFDFILALIDEEDNTDDTLLLSSPDTSMKIVSPDIEVASISTNAAPTGHASLLRKVQLGLLKFTNKKASTHPMKQ